MTKEWNFRGYIAVPLESYAKETLGKTSFSANGIETGELSGFTSMISAI